MNRMTARAAALAAALILTACEDSARPLGPPRPRASLDVQPSAGTTIAFVQTEARCGVDMSAGCDPDGGWGWSWWTNIAMINADGSNLVNVAYLAEGDVGAWVAPAWSPDGMRLAFQFEGEIRVTLAAGGNWVNLTNHPAFDYSPAWSPDGATIAFASQRDGSAELYVMRADNGSNLTRLTRGAGFTGRPAWSADGVRIAFDCVIESGNTDICAINADGTGLVRLTSDPGADYAADWSPTGQIAFATARYGATSEIAVMNGDGSAVTRVAAGVAGEEPDWSPDGSRLAFASELGVFVMRADGTSLALVTGGGSFGRAAQPAWRPVDTPPPNAPPVARLGAASCTLLTCAFDGTGSTDDGGIVGIAWSFGDGTGSFASLSPTHTYSGSSTFVVTLTVTDRFGQTSTATQNVTVVGEAPPPPPQISASCTYLECRFYTHGSSFESSMYSRTWTFGDGSTGTGPNPTHSYSAAGTFRVSATATDVAGRSTTSWLNLTVVPPPNQLPVARFTYSCARTTCTFDGRTSTDDQGIVSYAWNLGKPPGVSVSGAVVTFDYKRAGSYTVTLTVQDAAGGLNRLTRTIAVGK